MDKHQFSDRDYYYPDSPLHCKDNQCQKCEDALCNDEYKDKAIDRCQNCKVWRWRFVEGNDLIVGDWFDTAEEAEEANQANIDRNVKKEVDTLRINTIHTEMIHKFAHNKKRAKMSKEKKKEASNIGKYFKEEEVQLTSLVRSSEASMVGNSERSHVNQNEEKATTVRMITPKKNEHKRGVPCLYCGDLDCHNNKFGRYLYEVCAGLVQTKDDNNNAVKMETEHIETLFRQRYHVLAEWDAFRLHGCNDFEHRNTHKMELPECVKNGYFYSVQYLMRKSG